MVPRAFGVRRLPSAVAMGTTPTFGVTPSRLVLLSYRKSCMSLFSFEVPAHAVLLFCRTKNVCHCLPSDTPAHVVCYVSLLFRIRVPSRVRRVCTVGEQIPLAQGVPENSRHLHSGRGGGRLHHHVPVPSLRSQGHDTV